MADAPLIAMNEMLPNMARLHSPPADLIHRITDSQAKSMQHNGPRLLWVDDSQALLSLYKSVFESLGFAVWTTASPEEALRHASLATADVAILDYEMPEMNGEMLAYHIKNRHPWLPVILYSGSPCIPQSASVDAICAKGAPREELLTTIQRLTMPGRLHTNPEGPAAHARA